MRNCFFLSSRILFWSKFWSFCFPPKWDLPLSKGGTISMKNRIFKICFKTTFASSKKSMSPSIFTFSMIFIVPENWYIYIYIIIYKYIYNYIIIITVFFLPFFCVFPTIFECFWVYDFKMLVLHLFFNIFVKNWWKMIQN